MAYGYPGDKDWDSSSGKGIGAFSFNQKEGSLVGGYDVALKKAYAEELGIKPGDTFVPDHGEYKGRTVRYADTVPEWSEAPENYIDGYEPNHAPDKGVSNSTIAERTALMEKAGIKYSGSSVLPESMGGASFKRVSTPTDLGLGAVHKRVASPQELADAHQAEQEQAPAEEQPAAKAPTTETPSAGEPTEEETQPQPQTPTPGGAQPVAPIPHAQVAASQDPNQTFDAHSAALDPTDQRVTRRINPDTGSNKLVGQYFVPGDPVHEKYFLSGLSPEDKAKLPWISNAIGAGGPFSYLYDSAQQYKPGGKVTGQSRAMEQAASSAQQRISGEHEAQMQRVTMLPMQMMATEPGQDEEGNTIPSNLLLEGFGSDAVMNNASHLFNYAKKGDIPVPYSGPNDFNFQKDVSGYLHNQANGFRGDGSPMLDENGQPHPLHVANQKKPVPYVPHLLDRPRAEFVHAMLNIRAPKNKKPPTAPPGFGERAAWQRRVNEGYAGQIAGHNNLLAKLDKQFPSVRVYRARKNKETGEMEKYIHHHAPFSEASILEPTWRAYRLELMHHGMPDIGTESLRGALQSHLIHTAPEFKQTLATYRPHQGPGAAPISQDPEVGAPIGEGDERIKSAAVRYNNGDVYEGLYHREAEDRANAVKSYDHIPEHGFTTTHGRFLNRREAWDAAQKSKQISAPKSPGPAWFRQLDSSELRRGKAEEYDPTAYENPAPISENPEVGAPLGAEDNPERIKAAAIRFSPQHIYEGPTHGHALQEASKVWPVHSMPTDSWEDGFTTTTGRFLNRNDAWDLANKAKQTWRRPRAGWGLQSELVRYAPSPVSENPEVGAPVGTANPPGQSGLLESPEETAETAPSMEQGGGGIDFASPSVREGMTMKMAKLAMSNPKSGHQGYRDFNNNLEQGAAQAAGGSAPETRDAYGSWADGAENSLRLLYGKGQDRKQRKLVNAIRGLHSAQKQVLNFHYDDEGPNRIAHLSFHHDDPKHVSDLLDKHGIQYRTLEAPGKGQRVWAHVVDSDGKLYPKLEKLIKGGHVHDSYYRRGHADFIGDENGEDREAAAGRYRQILGEARDEADKRWQGRGNAPDAPRPQEWWEPFADQAEQNYQKLKAGDELKKQQLALDLQRAKADRENITPERAQELRNIQSTAQNWIANNPKLHPLAVHHFLEGGTEKVPPVIDPKTGKETKPTNEDIAAHFEARNPRLDYSKDKDRKTAADALTHDIMHNLATNPASFGWYNGTVDKAMDKMAEIAPEIKTDPRHAMALRLAMAVTSQGQKVVPNFESAYKIYRYWKENGKFPVMDAEEWKDQFGGGTKRDAMISNFKKLNDLWDSKDPQAHEKLAKMLSTELTVGDLAREHDLKVSGEAADHKLPGAAFMGPKIGIFYSNLNKIFHHTTMDLWFSRTLNRLGGNMFKFSPDALRKGGGMAAEDEDEEPDEKSKVSQLDRLENVMKSDGLTGVSKEDQAKISAEMGKLRDAKSLTRLQAMKLAPTLTKYVDERHKFYQDSAGYEGSYHKALKSEENLAAKNIDLNLHGTADAPRTSTERKQWRQIMEHVDANLKGAGLDINHADKQALLWYLEQRLFQGPEAKSSMDYLDAAHVLTRKVKNGEI